MGSSESLGSHPESFQVVDRKQRIFSKQGSTAHIGSGVPADQRMGVPYNAPIESTNPLKNIQRHVDRMLLAEYAPAGHTCAAAGGR